MNTPPYPFGFVTFVSSTAPERRALCLRLADYLSDIMQQITRRADAMQPPPHADGLERMRHAAVAQAVAQLRAEGHDLWSWDCEEDFERWGPDYTKDANFGIVVTFHFPDKVEVDWQGETITAG